jgi:serine/threonine protein kinase
MMVSGAVFAETFVVQRLTDYIALGSHPTEEDKGLRRVAQILVALKECIEDLEKFYKSLEPAPVDPPPSAAASSTARTKSRGQTSGPPRKIFPYYTKYLTKDGEHRFKYTTRLTPSDSPRAVFEAIMESPGAKKVVVKFTRTYCEEAHRLLAEHFLAPELLHHEVIEGTGIHLVVMDYVEVTTTKEGALKVESGSEHVGLLRKAIQLLHAQGFVFGDLREPNVLIAGAELKLVDFDWCGKIGEACYPTNINMSEGIPWPDGVRAEGKIQIAHDVTWFRQLTGAEL